MDTIGPFSARVLITTGMQIDCIAIGTLPKDGSQSEARITDDLTAHDCNAAAPAADRVRRRATGQSECEKIDASVCLGRCRVGRSYRVKEACERDRPAQYRRGVESSWIFTERDEMESFPVRLWEPTEGLFCICSCEIGCGLFQDKLNYCGKNALRIGAGCRWRQNWPATRTKCAISGVNFRTRTRSKPLPRPAKFEQSSNRTRSPCRY